MSKSSKSASKPAKIVSKTRKTAKASKTAKSDHAAAVQHAAAQPKTAKEGARSSKQATVIAMLQSPAGATMDAMTKATEWQPHSVRGFLAGVVRKKLGFALESKATDGGRVYSIGGSSSDPRPARSPAERT